MELCRHPGHREAKDPELMATTRVRLGLAVRAPRNDKVESWPFAAIYLSPNRKKPVTLIISRECSGLP